MKSPRFATAACAAFVSSAPAPAGTAVVLALLLSAGSLRAQVVEPPAAIARERERLERAAQAAAAGRIADATAVMAADLPYPMETIEGTSAYAHRLARLAFRLQERERDPEARVIGELALVACSSLLQADLEKTQPRGAARLLFLTGFLLQKTTNEPGEAKEAYLLAYNLDPEHQIDALRRYQTLEERERVIRERAEEAQRQKEVRP